MIINCSRTAQLNEFQNLENVMEYYIGFFSYLSMNPVQN